MLKRLFNSFGYAINGIIDMIGAEPNARIHLVFAVLVILSGWAFEVSLTEWSILGICIAAVFAAEAFNTAIEYLTDLASPEQHPLAGKAKDAAAGAVLCCAIGSAVAGLLIFGPKIGRLMGWF